MAATRDQHMPHDTCGDHIVKHDADGGPPSRPRRTRSPWLLLLSALGLMLALQAFALRFPTATLGYHLSIAGVHLVALAVVWASIVAALPVLPSRLGRGGWVAVGIGVTWWVIADAVAALGVVDLSRAAWSSPWMLLGLPAYLLVWGGLWTMPGEAARTRQMRALTALEMVIAALAALTLLWFLASHLVLMRAQTGRATDWLSALSLPALSAVTVAVTVALLARPDVGRFWRPRAILLLGALLMAAAEGVKAYFAQSAAASAAWPMLHAIGPLACAAFGVAAVAHARAYQWRDDDLGRPIGRADQWRVLLPYGLVVAAAVSAIVAYATWSRRDEELMLLLGMMVLFGLVMVRQWVAFAENRRLYRELHAAYREAAIQALTDPITQLPNYRAFIARLDHEVQRSARYGAPLSLVFADCDGFKRINDTYGHPVGDMVLRNIAEQLRHEVRTVDFVARYGGEEFVVLLPQTTTEQAMLLAERLRGRVEALVTRALDGASVSLTISAGVASYPMPSCGMEALISDADAAMYRAKRAGGNRVASAPV